MPNFLGSVTRSDVFGAVPIEGNNVDDEEALDNGLDIFLGELRNQFRMFARVFDSGVAEDFEAIAFRIIHQKKRDAIVCGKISSGEHLSISLVICESELGRTEHVKESRPAAAMLNIRPTVLGDAGHVKAVAPGNEFDFFEREQIMRRSVARAVVD